MASTHDAGENVVLQATFRDTAGALATPTTYTLYIERPAGQVVTVGQAQITVASTGVLEYADVATAHGLTYYRFVGTLGGRTVVEQSTYWVRKPRAVP